MAGFMAHLGSPSSTVTSFLRVLRAACGSLTCSEEEEAERILKDLSVERALIMKRLVDPLLVMDFYRFCSQEVAREIDLTKEVHLLARIEQALARMPSDGRPSIEVDGLLSELDQLVLQRASRSSTSVQPHLPSHYVFMQILSNLEEALALHLIDKANTSYRLMVNKIEQSFKHMSARYHAEVSLKWMRAFNVDQEKAEGDRLRNEFLERAQLKPPAVLRMIDCIATRDDEGQRVVLKDWKDCVQDFGFSAISHTFGQDVYKAFDCTCASICRVSSKPRCSFNTCPHDPAALNAASTTQFGVVQDIYKMCGYLCEAGVHYAWHDGVCIAQHDENEVRETIQHIGWIYSNAKETIIFLHYVGEPKAPIGAADVTERACRWHTRVWTLQEAALSKRRRYCIRVGEKPVGDWHRSLAAIKRNVHLWYQNGSSSVKLVEEEIFYEILTSLSELILGIPHFESLLNPFDMALVVSWDLTIFSLIETLQRTCFCFPTVDDALRLCGGRDSKHRGDRMNSILTLAGVEDFVAPKDTKLETSTLEFYEKQEQKGLARALFSINVTLFDRLHYTNQSGHEPQMHNWLPVLDDSTLHHYKDGLENGMRLTVLGNGRLEMKSLEKGDDDAMLYCKKVRIVKMPVEAAELDFNDRVKETALVQSLVSNTRGRNGVLEMNYSATHNYLYLPEAPAYPVGFISTNLSNGEGGLVNPAYNKDSDQDYIFMEDGDSFDAHLVTTGKGYDSSKMLLLYGNNILSGEVTKIGVFRPSHPSLFKNLANVKLEKVIIN